VPDWIPESARRAMPLSAARRILLAPLRSSHPLDWLRGTRRRRRQLLIAALLYERPAGLPGWMWHRLRRDARADLDPLESSRTQD